MMLLTLWGSGFACADDKRIGVDKNEVSSAQGKVHFASDGQYPPFTFITEAGELDGLDIAVAKAVCEAERLDCHFSQHRWDGMLTALKAFHFDAIVSAMPPRFKKGIEFTQSYYAPMDVFLMKPNTTVSPWLFALLSGKTLAKNQLSQPSENGGDQRVEQYSPPNSSLAAINHYASKSLETIGVKRGSRHEQFLRASFFPLTHLRSYSSYQVAFNALERGELMAVFADEVTLSALIRQSAESLIEQPVDLDQSASMSSFQVKSNPLVKQGCKHQALKGNTFISQQIEQHMAQHWQLVRIELRGSSWIDVGFAMATREQDKWLREKLDRGLQLLHSSGQLNELVRQYLPSSWMGSSEQINKG